jgi:glycosyltransferase involved in cell wall biosynthesis
MPSKFDTFSCVVLESLSCGLPVIAYKTKGPKDIILDDKCGYIVSNKSEMCEKIITFFGDEKLQKSFKSAALKRSKDYDRDKIMNKFLKDVDLSDFTGNVKYGIKFNQKSNISTLN